MSKNWCDSHLSQLDTFWLRSDEPKNPMIIHFCFHLDKDLPLNELSDRLQKWTEENVRFQSVVVKTGWNLNDWKRVPDFNPMKAGCLSEAALPTATERAVFDFIDSCVNQPLFPENTVMWRIFKATNVPWGGSLLVWRVHHCVCDGVSVAQAMQSFFSDSTPQKNKTPLSPAYVPTPMNMPPPMSPTKASPAYMRTSFVVAVSAVVVAAVGSHLAGWPLPWVLGIVAAALVPVTGKYAVVWGKKIVQAIIAGGGLRIPDTKTSLKLPLSGKRHTAVIGDLITIDAAKEVSANVSKRLGSRYTVNDVMCAMIGGVFRRYLLATKQDPLKVGMRMVIPVNVRLPSEPILCENRFATVFVSLPLAKPTATQRLVSVHDRMVEVKSGLEPISEVYLLRCLGMLPGWLFRALVNMNCTGASMIVTNVNANYLPMRLGAAKVVDAYAWVPSAGGIGVGLSFLSYANKVNIGMIADVCQVPDLTLLARCIREEWQCLYDEFGNKQQ